MEKENLNLDCWAIVELFGHQKIGGHCSTQLFGVAVMLRVDVPEFEHTRKSYSYEGPRAYIEEVVKTPAYTRYFGAGAIYAINPSTEEFVRKMLHTMSAPPDICLDIQRKALPPSEDLKVEWPEDHHEIEAEDRDDNS